jgi:hypothetical protein
MYDINLIIPTWAESAAENDGAGFITIPRHEVRVVVREYRRLQAELTEKD